MVEIAVEEAAIAAKNKDNSSNSNASGKTCRSGCCNSNSFSDGGYICRGVVAVGVDCSFLNHYFIYLIFLCLFLIFARNWGINMLKVRKRRSCCILIW